MVFCQRVLTEYWVAADAMSGVVVNVCLRVFPMLCQGVIAQYLLEYGGGAADAVKR